MYKQLLCALAAIICFVQIQPLSAQVVISEIGYTGVDFGGAAKWVELYNPGDTEQDVSDYFLCSFPQYDRISTLTALSGSTTIPAGGYLVVAWNELGDADGEVGLYANNSGFGDPANIVDYMQYGSAGHGREGVAVSAGVWEAGVFVAAAATGRSLALVPELGDFASGWKALNASAGMQNADVYEAVLSGGNEVPANVSRGQGTVTAVWDGTELLVSGAFGNLESDFNTGVGAHIHAGYAGQNGDVEIALTTTQEGDNRSGSFIEEDNTFDLTAEQLNLLVTRQMYVNVHSLDIPSGELRGQLLPSSSEAYKAVASGSAEAPANTSAARGGLVAEINGTILYVTGAFSGLESDFNPDVAGGSHIHAAPTGQNGGIEFGLVPTLGDDNRSGVFELANNMFEITAGQADTIRARGMYLNIHTDDIPSGEIRGQLIGLSSAPFLANLSGANEVPANGSQGTGMLLAELSGDSMYVSGSFSDLEGEFNDQIAGGSHIHGGLAGQNASIALTLTPTLASDNLSGTFEVADNAFELTDELIDALQARSHYANIHTLFSAPGEIRGQFLPAASIPLRAVFSGRAEGTPNGSQAIGGAVIEVLDNTVTLSGAFSGLMTPFATEIGAHIHDGFIDQEGDVVFALTPTLDDDNLGGVFAAEENVFTLTDLQKANLMNVLNYVNIHTEGINAGEIRGQIAPLMYRPVEAYLSFDNEVIESTNKTASSPFAQSDATGGVIALLGDTTLILAGRFSGLESDFNADIAGGAHIHRAPAQSNGGIAFSLTTTLDGDNRGGAFESASNTFTLSAEQRDSLLAGLFYVNIHSMDLPAGELRGQLLPSGNVAPDSAAIEAPADAAELVITGDPAMPFQATWTGNDANANEVFYTWQLATDATFDTVILEAKTGVETEFNSTFGDVAALLTSSGVALNGMITLYHRAVATDGSFINEGTPATVVLTRGTITSAEENGTLPERFAIRGNYPNPFNPTTTVQFDLPEAADVRIELYDLLGRNVMTTAPQAFAAGAAKRIEIDASSLASGVYLYRVFAETATKTQIQNSRLTLLK